MRLLTATIVATVSVLMSAIGAGAAPGPTSIQLVGTFNGVTCEPTDPANNMENIGGNVWRILKYIDEPGTPDTVYFKFTMDGSYLPMHWGWSGVWGVAELAWSPPMIATIITDPGFYYFYFNDADYTYWLDRPAGSISGVVSADHAAGVPAGTSITLYDAGNKVVGVFDAFTDDTYRFGTLGAITYAISAHAPGYRDTMVTGIDLAVDEAKNVPIHLTEVVGVLIASADCRRVDGGVKLTWATMAGLDYVSFDVYRGASPELVSMEKRNAVPVTANRVFEFFDRCEDPTKDVYYYLVERDAADPTRFGPMFMAGVPAFSGALGQNYPNPFNPSTTIPYTIGSTGAGKHVTLSFFDAAGHLVDRYAIGVKQAGEYAFLWNPSASRHGAFPSGVYYCRLEIDKETHTRKVVLLR